MLCKGHPLPIEMGRGGGWHPALHGMLRSWSSGRTRSMTRGSRRWAASCLFPGQGHRGFRHLFLCCRQAKCGIGLSLPCFLRYRSCQYVIVLEIYGYNMHLLLIVACSQIFFLVLADITRRAGLVQAVESYRLWPEGPGFESRSPRIAQAWVRLATDTLPQTPHRAGALCTGHAKAYTWGTAYCFFFNLYISSTSIYNTTSWANEIILGSVWI